MKITFYCDIQNGMHPNAYFWAATGMNNQTISITSTRFCFVVDFPDDVFMKIEQLEGDISAVMVSDKK